MEEQINFLRSKEQANPDDFKYEEKIFQGLKYIEKYINQPRLSSQKKKIIFEILIKIIFTCEVSQSADSGSGSSDQGAYNKATNMLNDMSVNTKGSDISALVADVLSKLMTKDFNIENDRLESGIPLIARQFSDVQEIIDLQEKHGDVELSFQTFENREGNLVISLTVEGMNITAERLSRLSFSAGHTHGFQVPLRVSKEDTTAATSSALVKDFILAVDRTTHTLQLAYYDRHKHGWVIIRNSSIEAQRRIAEKLIEFGILKDKAMAGERQDVGGIDLTPANMHLQTQNSGDSIKFHMDPAMLKQLQNAPGFVPVIINIQPLGSLRDFLGLSQPSPSNVV